MFAVRGRLDVGRLAVDLVIGLLAVVALIWIVRWFRRAVRQAKANPPAADSELTAALDASPQAPAEASPSVARVRPRPVPATRADAQLRGREAMPFAAPHRSGPLFSYGGSGGRRSRSGHLHDGLFAVIDVETTGLTPGRGDRIIEIAVALVDATGRVEDEYATLINPDGQDTGPVFIHGISNDAARDAPRFVEVAGELLSRLDGAVVVAHNASFEERFLAAEFARAGITTAPLPALCTLWLARETFSTPNHKLATLARHAGVPLVDAHAALGDVRAVAALLPLMFAQHPHPLVYGCPPATGLSAAHPVGVVRPTTRAVELRKGSDGWMASLLARLPLSAADATTAEATAYLDALSTVLQDGKITGDEARVLARLAGRAGLGGAQVAALNERFLEGLREAAFADDVLTATELRQLKEAAMALSVPDYFDDLDPVTAASRPATRPSRDQPLADDEPALHSGERPVRQRRCGHCRAPGHYRSTCPQITAVTR